MSAPTPAPSKKPGLLPRALRITRGALVGTVLIFATVYFVRAFDSRKMPELESWHTESMPGEFRAEDAADATLADYLATEERVFAELDRFYDRIEARPDLAFSRFNPGGPIDPRRFEVAWNRTFELEPELVRGAALLVHGLTDSPYSMRRVGEILRDEGYYVLGLRLPGHGTTPGSLAEVHWKDWRAAVRVAARHAAARSGDGPLILIGYSAGGALVVDYCAEVLLGSGDPPADRLVLFSPAIGITRFAIVSSWHRLSSWLPYFERFAFQDIEPEFDPYKYNSFPKNGAVQMRALSLAAQQGLSRLARSGAIEGFPRTLAFQSVVDSTVLTSAITTHLFAVLGPSSELVLFDINREAALRPFFSSEERGLLERLEEDPQRAYRLTLVTNRNEESWEIVAQTWPAHETTSRTTVLGARWPTGVYSLSHVAMPFPPDDPIYGNDVSGTEDAYPLRLGTLAPRGERGLLRVSVNRLMRLRFNPFFAYVDARLREE